MTSTKFCDVCKCKIEEVNYGGSATSEYCSEFCENTTSAEKDAYLKLQPGEWGVWPCSECHHAMEGEYEPGGWCSGCDPKVKLRKAEKRIAELEKERDLYKTECQKAYGFNRQINKDWQFKLERLKLEMQHYQPSDQKRHLPWKKMAKVLFARNRIHNHLSESEIEGLFSGIREHRDQKGHDRCWLDDEKLYQLLPEGPENYNPKLPPREEFLGNCVRFFESRQGDCPKLHEWGDSEIEKKRLWASRWKKLAKKYRQQLVVEIVDHEMINHEIERLDTLINNPQTNEFFEAVKIEAAHQKERWASTDPQKTDADWYWLIGYLAGKAMWNPVHGSAELSSREKRLHRIITVAAAACNWWKSHQ